MSKRIQAQEVELHPDAWDRFGRFIRDIAKAGPQHRKGKPKGESGKSLRGAERKGTKKP
jgi:hypothetical protein